jgi:tetratricopeptide (TPR) repeat protein
MPRLLGPRARLAGRSRQRRRLGTGASGSAGLAFGGEAIREAERRGHPVGLCIALVNSAIVLLWNGSLDEAEKVIGRLETQADCYALRGELLGAQGGHESASERLREALVRLHEENHRVISSGAQHALADSLMQAGHLRQAQMIIEDAISYAERSGGKFGLSELLHTQGEIRLRTGDADGPESALISALGVAEQQGATSWRLRSGEALVRLWLSRGRAEAAYAESSALLTLLNNCGPGQPLQPTCDRLLALRAEAGGRL